VSPSLCNGLYSGRRRERLNTAALGRPVYSIFLLLFRDCVTQSTSYVQIRCGRIGTTFTDNGRETERSRAYLPRSRRGRARARDTRARDMQMTQIYTGAGRYAQFFSRTPAKLSAATFVHGDCSGGSSSLLENALFEHCSRFAPIGAQIRFFSRCALSSAAYRDRYQILSS